MRSHISPMVFIGAHYFFKEMQGGWLWKDVWGQLVFFIWIMQTYG